ncbi:hypothetical protein D0T50_00695 [Bacteroides sp. 214]|nr:hypothetical protein [Bacteroides sp. 214]
MYQNSVKTDIKLTLIRIKTQSIFFNLLMDERPFAISKRSECLWKMGRELMANSRSSISKFSFKQSHSEGL